MLYWRHVRGSRVRHAITVVVASDATTACSLVLRLDRLMPPDVWFFELISKCKNCLSTGVELE